jgi:enoyl-CoA hydratase/carnithine racemase
MASQIRVHVTRPLATVEVDARDPHDTIDALGWQALAEAFRALSDREDITAVVVRGTGARGFAAGQDEGGTADEAAALAAVRACRHPTVAVIEGVCAGSGLEIAACCDLRVCGESSRFGASPDRPERRGSFQELGPLAQLLGGSPALADLRSGDFMDAERARTVGLVNHVHPDVAVVEQGYGLAARVAAGAPLVNRWHKQVVRRLYERAP